MTSKEKILGERRRKEREEMEPGLREEEGKKYPKQKETRKKVKGIKGVYYSREPGSELD